jgi:hypothetical protein
VPPPRFAKLKSLDVGIDSKDFDFLERLKGGRTSLEELKMRCVGIAKCIPNLENLCRKLKKGGKLELEF